MRPERPVRCSGCLRVFRVVCKLVMKREPVDSTVIRKIGYDHHTSILEVEFCKGPAYRYFEVPDCLHRGFMLAKSKGEYFNRRINDRFRFEEIRWEQPEASRTGHGSVGLRHDIELQEEWSGRLDSNQRHLGPKPSALPG